MQGRWDPPNLPGFSVTYTVPADRGPCVGTAIYVPDSINSSNVIRNTTLQAVVVCLYSGQCLYRVCSVYLQTGQNDYDWFSRALLWVAHPLLVCGDINTCHPLSENAFYNQRGVIFELVSGELSPLLLHDCSPTYFHFQTGSLFMINLMIDTVDTAGFHVGCRLRSPQ